MAVVAAGKSFHVTDREISIYDESYRRGMKLFDRTIIGARVAMITLGLQELLRVLVAKHGRKFIGPVVMSANLAAELIICNALDDNHLRKATDESGLVLIPNFEVPINPRKPLKKGRFNLLILASAWMWGPV